MTLRFIDSFDDRSTANAAFKWTSSNSTNTISTTYGRYGQGLFLSGDGNQWLALALDTAQQTWIVGFAMKSSNKYFPNDTVFRFYDVGSSQCFLRLDQDGRMRFYRGDGTLLLTTTACLIPQTWQYIEVKVKIDNAAGTVDIRCNDVSVGSVAAVDTTTTANNYATEFRFTGNVPCYIDDFYICDSAGADTFRGDSRIETLLPTGAGNYTAWTPSAGANWQNVDDAYASAPCPDGDSTYNESGTTTQRDSYAYSNLVITSGVVLGVQVSPNVRKTDAGARSEKAFTRVAGTDYDGSSKSVGDTYASYPELWVQNPNTAAVWSIAEVNGAEFGILDFA